MCISGIGKGSDGVGSVLSDCIPYRAVNREAERGDWESSLPEVAVRFPVGIELRVQGFVRAWFVSFERENGAYGHRG